MKRIVGLLLVGAVMGGMVYFSAPQVAEASPGWIKICHRARVKYIRIKASQRHQNHGDCTIGSEIVTHVPTPSDVGDLCNCCA